MSEDHHLTRQDEDMSSTELEAEDTFEGYAFGNWPELFGLVLTGLFVWLTFAFTG